MEGDKNLEILIKLIKKADNVNRMYHLNDPDADYYLKEYSETFYSQVFYEGSFYFIYATYNLNCSTAKAGFHKIPIKMNIFNWIVMDIKYSLDHEYSSNTKIEFDPFESVSMFMLLYKKYEHSRFPKLDNNYMTLENFHQLNPLKIRVVSYLERHEVFKYKGEQTIWYCTIYARDEIQYEGHKIKCPEIERYFKNDIFITGFNKDNESTSFGALNRTDIYEYHELKHITETLQEIIIKKIDVNRKIKTIPDFKMIIGEDENIKETLKSNKLNSNDDIRFSVFSLLNV